MPAKKYEDRDDVKNKRLFVVVTKKEKEIYLRNGGSALVHEMIEKLNIKEQKEKQRLNDI